MGIKKDTPERMRRLFWFKKNVLPFLAYEYDVSEPSPSAFKVSDTRFGDLLIYPKGDKIQLQNGSWVGSEVVSWLNYNILKEKAPKDPNNKK